MGGALKEEPERSPSGVWGLKLNGRWVECRFRDRVGVVKLM